MKLLALEIHSGFLCIHNTGEKEKYDTNIQTSLRFYAAIDRMNNQYNRMYMYNQREAIGLWYGYPRLIRVR